MLRIMPIAATKIDNGVIINKYLKMLRTTTNKLVDTIK